MLSLVIEIPQYRLSNFLLFYQATPHSTIRKPPSEVMLRRPLRTLLDLLKPNGGIKVLNQQGLQKSNHDTLSQFRQFEVGLQVIVRSYRDIDPSWISVKIVDKRVDVMFLVEIEDGTIWKRHVDQLLSKGQSTELDDTWKYPNHVTFPETQFQLDQNTGPNQSSSEPGTVNSDDWATNTTQHYEHNEFIHQINTFDNCSHG